MCLFIIFDRVWITKYRRQELKGDQDNIGMRFYEQNPLPKCKDMERRAKSKNNAPMQIK